MRKQRAVFTIVFNESVMLPIWLNYYSKYYAWEDMYVIDHGSTDGSTDNLKCNVVKLEVPTIVDCELQLHIAHMRQQELFVDYETVLHTDVDEIIMPHPSLGTLGDYVEHFDRDFVSCNGFVICQHPTEAPLFLESSILDQRAWWFPSEYSCKPLLARVPLRWDLGCHTQKNTPHPQKDENLFMLHLQRMDKAVCLYRHMTVASRESCNNDQAKGYGMQRYIVEPDHFNEWFYKDDGAMEKLTPIPQEIRETRVI